MTHLSDSAWCERRRRIAKEDHELLGPKTVGRWLEYVPPLAVRTTFRWTSRREAPNQLFNLIVSNVPGPRLQGRIARAAVTEIYSVGPLAAGSAMNLTVWSYVDQLNISVLSDDQTFGDVHDAVDAFVEASRRTSGGRPTCRGLACVEFDGQQRRAGDADQGLPHRGRRAAHIAPSGGS